MRKSAKALIAILLSVQVVACAMTFKKVNREVIDTIYFVRENEAVTIEPQIVAANSSPGIVHVGVRKILTGPLYRENVNRKDIIKKKGSGIFNTLSGAVITVIAAGIPLLIPSMWFKTVEVSRDTVTYKSKAVRVGNGKSEVPWKHASVDVLILGQDIKGESLSAHTLEQQVHADESGEATIDVRELIRAAWFRLSRIDVFISTKLGDKKSTAHIVLRASDDLAEEQPL